MFKGKCMNHLQIRILIQSIARFHTAIKLHHLKNKKYTTKYQSTKTE